MGNTWVCEDTHQPIDNGTTEYQKVVVKAVKPSIAQDPDLLKRFEKEGLLIQQLSVNCDRLPKWLDSFEEHGLPCYVQEYIHGRDLSHNKNPWLPEEIFRFLRECLTTLSYIHSHRVIHRDIKLANIIQRQSDGAFFIVDFGIAKELLPHENVGYTGLATYLYAAPEVLLQQGAGYYTDIFCLGLCALALVYGKEEILFQQKTALILLEALELTDETLIRVMKKMLAPVGERFATADEVLAELPPTPEY